MMKLNKDAMEKFSDGAIGKVPGLIGLFNHLADTVEASNAGNGEFTLAWNDEEVDLIPEIIIRVRKPRNEE